jgi:hypothetical protein
MAADIVVNQFEVGNDAKGSARAAAWIQARLSGVSPAASKVLATARYDRETGASFLVIVMGTTSTAQQPSAHGTVAAVVAEIESAGVASLATAMNAAEANSVPLTNLVSFTVASRKSGSAFATAIMST